MKQVSTTLRKSLVACVATFLVIGLTGLMCEVGFRTLLFSQVAFMERFRDPSLYADPLSSNNWWKLYHAFNKPTNATTKHPHPLLGWANKKSSQDTYLHVENGTLEAGPIQPQWQSALWAMEPSGGGYFVRFRNVWRSDTYLNVEQGHLESTPIGQDWLSADWWLLK